MNTQKRPELYVVQTPEHIRLMNEMPLEERQKQAQLNQIYIPTEAEQQHAREVAESLANLTVDGMTSMMNAALSLFGFILEGGSERLKLEREMKFYSRVQILRQAIQKGKRMRIGQMEDIVHMHDLNAAKIATMTDLPIDVVQKAIKRWFFF